MNIKDHLSNAFSLTLSHIVPLVLMTLVMTILGVVTLGILFPVMLAGYSYALLLLVREGRPPTVGDLFSHMKLFFPLLIFGVISFIVLFIGYMLLLLPGILLTLALIFSCLYLLFFMTDKDMGIIDAIRASYDMAVSGEISEHVVVVILYIIFTIVGSSVILLTLLTQPFATLFIASVFDERLKSVDSVEPELDV